MLLDFSNTSELEDLAVGHIRCEGRGNVESVIVNGTDIAVVGDVIPRPTNDLLTAACGACTVGEIQSPKTTVSKTQFLNANFKEMMLYEKNQPIFDSQEEFMLQQYSTKQVNAF